MCPVYDLGCRSCDWQSIDELEPVNMPSREACPECGSYTVERQWLSKPPFAVGDEMDHLQVNGTKEPIRFRSKIEFRRWLKENGYRVKDSHACMEGTDKAEHTTAWEAGGKAWLKNAEELAKAHHNGGFVGNDPEPDASVNVRWVDVDTGQ